MDNYSRAYENLGSVEQSGAFAKLMRSVYIWMTGSLVLTALTAMIVAKNESLLFTIISNPALMWGALIAEVAMVWILSARIMKMSFATAGIMMVLYSILNGVTLSILCLVYTAESIASAFFITAGTFAAMSVVGMVIKKDLSTYGRIFTMLLIGLIIATIVNIFMHSSGLAMVINYVGVLVFVGLTAYDTQKIKQMLMASSQYGVTNDTNKIALMGSLSLYLDFINLFLFILRLLGGGSRD